MNQKNPTPTGKTAAKVRPTETLKVAYTRTDDGKAFGDVVVFGTDEARSDLLRAEPDIWWRIADLAKGQTLADALAQTSKRSSEAAGAVTK